MTTVKAISLWEPWATLVRLGRKPYETRHWETLYRGPLLICAAKGGIAQAELMVQCLKFGLNFTDLHPGKAVALVNLEDCLSTEIVSHSLGREVLATGDFSPGRYAWKFQPISLDFEPFAVKGRQGFFNIEIPNSLNPETLYRRDYAERLVKVHGYDREHALAAADGAEYDPKDHDPKDHADDLASYEREDSQ